MQIARLQALTPASVLCPMDERSAKALRRPPSLRVSTIMGRLRRRASEPSRLLRAVRLLILSRSHAKTGEAWTVAPLRPKSAEAWPLPSFACSQPILVETRSAKDLIRGSRR